MRLPLLPAQLHTTDRPSSTAQWTTVGRALELERPPGERIVTDEYAPLFLSRASRAVLAAFRTAGPAVRLAERQQLAGLSAFGLCRHRFIDEHLLAWLDEDGASDADQVLVLGAGYESRAYRFAAELGGRPVFEVDLPPLSRRKAAIVAAHPDVFGGGRYHRVEINFRTQSLAERLDECGFAAGLRTYVVWEGVSPYLSREAVLATLETLGSVCGTGSVLAMDLWDGAGGGGLLAPVRRLGAQAIALVGEPITFGARPDAAAALLDTHGFAVFDLAQARELESRYSTGGRPCERSTYVLAARRY